MSLRTAQPKSPITKEITAPVPLCDARGRLNPEAIGWSRMPWHRCNLRGAFLRKKRWDYWCVMSPELAFSAVVADVDYFALASVYVLEYDTQRFADRGIVLPFSRRMHHGDTTLGETRLSHRALSLVISDHGGEIHLEAACNALKGLPFSARLTLTRPKDHESLNVVVPWRETRFQFTSKQHALPAAGEVTWGDQVYSFDPATAFAVRDFGRGIWPYRTAWNWAAFSCRVGKDVVGVNMGARWTDGTGANENGILLNGRLHKLFEDVEFRYEATDFMRPWQMRTCHSKAVDLTFTPFFDRHHAVNLGILRAKTHQCFGRYTGTVSPGGQTLAIDNVLGWAEEHHARW